MMKTVFKTIQFETMAKFIRGLFQMRNTERNLRGSRKLVILYVNKTTYGLHFFRYTSANMWNKLTEDLRSIMSVIIWLIVCNRYNARSAWLSAA